jgi:hypothetical protein
MKHVMRECPDADEMEVACSPWYREPVRDPGDYVGQHRRSESDDEK